MSIQRLNWSTFTDWCRRNPQKLKLLGVAGAGGSVYYATHLEKAPITGNFNRIFSQDACIEHV